MNQKLNSFNLNHNKVMTKHIKQLVFLILLTTFGLSNAQNREDHLEPVQSIYDIYDFQFEYYSKVRKVLFEDLYDAPDMRFQIMPSFQPESVLNIDHDMNNDKYDVVYHVCDKSIWYTKKWKKIKVHKYKTTIDKTSYELLKKLYDSAILNIRIPKKDILGYDGVNYFFSSNIDGLKSGVIWSPPSKSNTGKLVEISLELIELTKSEPTVISFSDSLKQKIKNLTTELQ